MRCFEWMDHRQALTTLGANKRATNQPAHGFPWHWDKSSGLCNPRPRCLLTHTSGSLPTGVARRHQEKSREQKLMRGRDGPCLLVPVFLGSQHFCVPVRQLTMERVLLWRVNPWARAVSDVAPGPSNQRLCPAMPQRTG